MRRAACALQVEGMKMTLKTATAPPPPMVDRTVVANDKFVGAEQERQQLIMK